MFAKFNNLFSKPIPLPQPIDKILHTRVPRYLTVILIVIFGLPVILTLISFAVGGLFALYLYIIYDIGLLPPDRISYLGLIIITLISCAIILPLYWWLKRCCTLRLVKLALVIIFVGQIAFFWYCAWWREYMHYNVWGYSADFAIEDGVYMILNYVKALVQTVSVSLLLVIPWLFLKKR